MDLSTYLKLRYPREATPVMTIQEVITVRGCLLTFSPHLAGKCNKSQAVGQDVSVIIPVEESLQISQNQLTEPLHHGHVHLSLSLKYGSD